MSLLDFCQFCGGHGAVTVPTTPDDPYAVRDRRGNLIANPAGPFRWADCGACDGRDRVTPHLEATAEA